MYPKLLAVMAVGLLIGADTPDIKEVEMAISSLNKAFQTRDTDKIKDFLADDHVAVTGYYGGPMDKAGQLKNLSDLRLTEYAAGKLKMTALGKDVVLVTYPLTMKGTFKGKEVAARNFASAIWARRGGKWVEAFYQETPLR